MGAKFKCIGCGLCCHNLKRFEDKYEELNSAFKNAVDKFPYKLSEGPCEKLDADGKCTVYDDRPLLCNVKSFYNLNKEKINTPRQEFYALVNLGCIEMMNKAEKPSLVNKLLEQY